MPISRFKKELDRDGTLENYEKLLRDNFEAETLNKVMCRSTLSVDWRGYVYDCDFNQMLLMPLVASDKPRTHLSELLKIELKGMDIATGEHCYGCTAGQGSSCGGALN